MRERGDWEAWLHFFLTGVKETADQAGSAARRILALFEDHLRKVETLGRASGSALRVYQQLQRNPVVSIGALARQTGLSFPTITSAIGI